MAFRSDVFKIAWVLAIAVIQAARCRPVMPERSITLVLVQPRHIFVGLEEYESALSQCVSSL